MNVKVGVKDQQLIHALFHGVFLSVVCEWIRHWNWQQLISVENIHACTCVVGNTKEPGKKNQLFLITNYNLVFKTDICMKSCDWTKQYYVHIKIIMIVCTEKHGVNPKFYPSVGWALRNSFLSWINYQPKCSVRKNILQPKCALGLMVHTICHQTGVSLSWLWFMFSPKGQRSQLHTLLSFTGRKLDSVPVKNTVYRHNLILFRTCYVLTLHSENN